MGEKVFGAGEGSLLLCCLRSSSEAVSMCKDSDGTVLMVPFGVFEGIG